MLSGLCRLYPAREKGSAKVFGGGVCGRRALWLPPVFMLCSNLHVDRLAEDHLHARRIAEALANKVCHPERILPVETNNRHSPTCNPDRILRVETPLEN